MSGLSILIKSCLLCCIICFAQAAFSQVPVLPSGYAPWEIDALKTYKPFRSASGIVTPPASFVRASAEWEEIDALMVTWTSFVPTVREIVKHAKEECKVFIVCSDSNEVKNDLIANSISLENIYYLQEDFNSIWIRDYGPWNIYKNNTDSLYLVDWIYNRPRPLDDAIPGVMSEYTGIPLYQTIEMPYDLVHTGGNFMTDGWGTGFSSKLVLDENDGFDYSLAPKTEEAIDSLMQIFMGINRYIKMETLPYDEIHHIDMHMKLLDEETLLVGEYPEGVADGPQIEENIQYITDNFQSVFGTPYKIVRIPMPPDFEGQFPDDGPWWNTGDYRTYTNMVFVNKTVLVPVYEEKFDTTALRIIQENLPGYKVIGIESNEIIQSLGAIHCITKEIASNNPLLITHQPLKDTDNNMDDYPVSSWILHNSGIINASVFYRTDPDSDWTESSLTLIDEATNTWEGFIPTQSFGTTVQYYISAEATNGKTQHRPITAPEGYWQFKVNDGTTVIPETLSLEDISVFIYPNPVEDILTVQASALHTFEMQLVVQNLLGEILFKSPLESGKLQLRHIDFSQFPSGYYLLSYGTNNSTATTKVVKL